MRSIAIALFAAAASRGRGRRGKKSTAILEMPGAGRVPKLPSSLPAPGALPPLTLETIELDDLVTVPDVVW